MGTNNTTPRYGTCSSIEESINSLVITPIISYCGEIPDTKNFDLYFQLLNSTDPFFQVCNVLIFTVMNELCSNSQNQ